MRDDRAPADEELIQQFLNGNNEAYGMLAERWLPMIFGLCRARVPQHADALDVAQDTLLQGLRGLGALRDPHTFRSWLRQIAVNACADWWRRPRSPVPFSSQPNNPAIAREDRATRSPEAAMEREENRRRVWAAIDALPEHYREVIVLYYIEQRGTHHQIAQWLGEETNTISIRLARARAMLRDLLWDCQPPPNCESA